MKAVIISPYQFRLRRGIERFIYSLANSLAQDYDVDIIIYTWASKQQIEWGKWHTKIKIRKVPEVYYFQKIVAMFFYWFWVKYDKPECTFLNFLFHGEEILPKKNRYFYILNYPASQVPNRYEMIKKIIPKFINLNFIAVSEMVKREALPYIQGKKIEVVVNGVDMQRFYPAGNKNFSSKTLRLITLAALEERKGIQFVIKALALLHGTIDIKYDIYGDGPYRENILLLIQKLRLSQVVTLHASVDNPEKFLKDADIFCLLSKGEAFALSVLEAMSCGLPVIVSQYPPYDEYITTETGIQVERENSLAVANAIKSLLDFNKRQYLGCNGRRLIEERFSWDKIASKYYDILVKV